MPAWMRTSGWIVVVGSFLGSAAEAEPLSWTRARDHHRVFWLPIHHAPTAPPTWSGVSAANNPPPAAHAPATTPLLAVPLAPTATATASWAPVSAPLTVQSPAQAAASAPAAAATTPAPDAFINFGNGTYAEAGVMTTGAIQPWYTSPSVQHVYGGTPTPQQEAEFTSAVLKDVEQTYQLSGVPVTATLDPNAHAAHTLSVASGASYAANPAAIGITDVGANGFGFIDRLSYASTPDQLEWAVAHNVSHELMHAFGVAVHHDQTGTYLDSAVASWDLLTNPGTTFSPAAAQDIQANLAGARSGSAAPASGLEVLDLAPAAVPEPATWVVWASGAAAALAARGLRRRPRPRH